MKLVNHCSLASNRNPCSSYYLASFRNWTWAIPGVFTLLSRVFFEEHVLTIPLLKAQGERSTVVWLPQLSLVPQPPITASRRFLLAGGFATVFVASCLLGVTKFLSWGF